MLEIYRNSKFKYLFDEYLIPKYDYFTAREAQNTEDWSPLILSQKYLPMVDDLFMKKRNDGYHRFRILTSDPLINENNSYLREDLDVKIMVLNVFQGWSEKVQTKGKSVTKDEEILDKINPLFDFTNEQLTEL